MDAAWPVITNRNVLSVNQLWAGDSGRINSQGGTTTFPNCGHAAPCHGPAYLVLSKSLPSAAPSSKVAVLLVNNDIATATVSANLSSIYGLGSCGRGSSCAVTDVWNGSALANATSSIDVELGPHESKFVFVTSSFPAPPPSPPSPPSPNPGPPGPAPPPSDACKWVPDSGLTGGDIAFDAKSATKEACCAACIANKNCKAACFRPQNHTGPGGVGCHMKAAVNLDRGGRGDGDAVVCIPTFGRRGL